MKKETNNSSKGQSSGVEGRPADHFIHSHSSGWFASSGVWGNGDGESTSGLAALAPRSPCIHQVPSFFSDTLQQHPAEAVMTIVIFVIITTITTSSSSRSSSSTMLDSLCGHRGGLSKLMGQDRGAGVSSST